MGVVIATGQQRVENGRERARLILAEMLASYENQRRARLGVAVVVPLRAARAAFRRSQTALLLSSTCHRPHDQERLRAVDHRFRQQRVRQVE